jgi:hypothetical protein
MTAGSISDQQLAALVARAAFMVADAERLAEMVRTELAPGLNAG